MAPTPPETPELSNMTTEEDRTAAGGETPSTSQTPVVEPVNTMPSTTSGAPVEISDEPRELVGTAPENDNLTVVLDSGTDPASEQPKSIFAAAQAEKTRRLEVGESTMVLNNQTLKEHSKGGSTFVVDESEGEGAGEDAEAEPGESEAAPEEETTDLDAEDEEYWRRLVYDLRREWRNAYDDIEEYESEIARLRRDFYAEDDPFYRDSQIKPAWDKALKDLEEAQRTVERSQEELEKAMDEGHRAGALPGWLREGIELEPEIDPEDPLAARDDQFHEPSEPVVVEEDGDGG
jgi:hypothetical protein